MEVIKLSQKQRMTVFTVILLIGFVAMAAYIAKRLDNMAMKYTQSGDISQGAVTIYATQADLLNIAASRGDLTVEGVEQAKASIAALKEEVVHDVDFLNSVGLSNDGQQLSNAIDEFTQSMMPWLDVKSELGFNVDEGKLGQLKAIAATIEKKIQDEGMVTVLSDFQNVIKAQQNYLLAPTEKNMKLFNRAMLMFVNTSNSYAMLNLYKQEVDDFKATFIRVGELSQQVGELDAALLATESQAEELISSVTQRLKEVSSDYRETAHNDSNQTLWSVLAACAILAAVTILIFVMIGVSLTRSLTQTKAVLDALSKGDLTKRLKVGNNSKDEFTQLAVAINDSCEHLAALVQRVQERSVALSGDAASLNKGLDNLVHAQTQVIHQTDLLASATEEVSVTTQEVSNSLSVVSEVSQSSTQAAKEGSEVISAALTSLDDIGHILTNAASHIQLLEQASEKVDSVMDIINGIAEQTNLLALNAAIEAARAGEQGRGFAVVADEVRSLAVRTVSAVTEISDTIETMKKESAEVIQYIGHSEDTMKTGKARGDEAMGALKEIIEKASEAAQQTEVIASSIRELATTSHSMADNMMQISSSMKTLEESNEHIRDTSRVVDQRSTGLSEDCQRFVV